MTGELTVGVSYFAVFLLTIASFPLSSGDSVPNGMPLNILPEVKFVQISCSGYHCCAIDANGKW
jgi:hypothetical protein